MKTRTAAEAASSPLTIQAGAGGRDQPRRERRPPPCPFQGGNPATDTVGADAAGSGPPPVPGPASVAVTCATCEAEIAATGPVGRATRPASAAARDWMTPSSATRRPALGRLPGCLARQPSTSQRRSSGTSPRVAGLLTSRYISAALVPAPNGP
jgi:hypothetical protein